MRRIYDLKLHEEIEINNDSFVMRVPNGFIYTDIWYKEKIVDDENDLYGIGSTREEYFVTRTFVNWKPEDGRV